MFQGGVKAFFAVRVQVQLSSTPASQLEVFNSGIYSVLPGLTPRFL